MEREKDLPQGNEWHSPKEDFPSDGVERDDQGGLSSPTWRGMIIAVVAAIILSVTATFLLGGSFIRSGTASATGCGPGSACCPPVAGGK